MRHDFSEVVKRTVAARAGHRCSSPTCRAATSGPQLSVEKALNVGVAAHIAAASPGGPRYDPGMSAADRCSTNNAIWLCQTCAKLVDNDENRFTVAGLIEWKRQSETEALAVVGKTSSPARAEPPTGEQQIRRNLKVRDRLERAMLLTAEERRLKRTSRPYEKFRTRKIVIRSIDDTLYPEADAAPPGRISSWFIVEPYDFYHGGLEVILSIRLAAIDDFGNWAFVDDGAHLDEAKFRVVKAWHLGRIPWRNIREIDNRGDEYYRGPHLYCAFADAGMPYEEFVARELGDDYDWPLDSIKKAPDITAA